MNPNSTQQRIAFGYNRGFDNKIEIYEGQAAVVKLIFIYYLEGRSIEEIKYTLEDMGIPSPLNRKKWGKQTISNILSNPHYIGSGVYLPLFLRKILIGFNNKKRERIKNRKTKIF